MTLSDAQREKAWPKRFKLYGPSGRKPVPKWRRKPSARAKRLAEQSLIARVSRETPERETENRT